MTPEMNPYYVINQIDIVIKRNKLLFPMASYDETEKLNNNIEALEMAKQAVEKQIHKKAKKVIRTDSNIKTISEITKFNFYHPGNEKEVPEYKEYKYNDYLCPNCNALTKDGTPEYCWRCGQALNWSEE